MEACWRYVLLIRLSFQYIFWIAFAEFLVKFWKAQGPRKEERGNKEDKVELGALVELDA